MITKALVWCEKHNAIEEWFRNDQGYSSYFRLVNGEWIECKTFWPSSMEEALTPHKYGLKVLFVAYE